MLNFRDTGREIELKGALLNMKTKRNYNVDLASLSDKKSMYDFANKMYFDVKVPGNKSTRDWTLVRLPKSPGLWISDSDISNTLLLPSDPNKLCNRLNFLLQEKQAGNNCDIFNEEISATIQKLSEYKFITKKQRNSTS